MHYYNKLSINSYLANGSAAEPWRKHPGLLGKQLIMKRFIMMQYYFIVSRAEKAHIGANLCSYESVITSHGCDFVCFAQNVKAILFAFFFVLACSVHRCWSSLKMMFFGGDIPH